MGAGLDQTPFRQPGCPGQAPRAGRHRQASRKWQRAITITTVIAITTIIAPTMALGAVPQIAAEEATAVDQSTLSVQALLSAENESTSFALEDVSGTQFEATGWASAVSEQEREVPASSEPVSIQTTLVGLRPDTVYHVRFRAHNGSGTSFGPGIELTTLPPTAGALPDARRYELVSTSGLFGEPYGPTDPQNGSTTPTPSLFQAAMDGNSLAYVGEPAETGGGGAIGKYSLGNDWLSTRTAQGWKTEDITPPTAGEQAFPPLYQAFSSDLSSGALVAVSNPNESAPEETQCQALYARNIDARVFEPLANVAQLSAGCGHPLFVASVPSADLSVFQSEAALTPSALEATEVPPGAPGHATAEFVKTKPCEFGCNLYAISHGSIQLINLLPESGEPTVPNAMIGGFQEESETQPNFSNAISADGSKIFWTDTKEGRRVFVRENLSSTVQVSGEGPAEYWTASPDGRYALYTEGGVLWAFDTEERGREELAGEGLHGEPADVEGVIGVNTTGQDLAYVYFVASTVLAENTNEQGETAQAGQPNLYVRHENPDTRKSENFYVATLSSADNNLLTTEKRVTRSGDWASDLGERTAEVTADGTHIGFESEQSLTGYNNYDPAVLGLHSIPEVYVFNAVTGRLSCASCDPSGLPPVENQPASASQVPVSAPAFTTMRHWLSESGNRVFFNTPQPLSPRGDRGKWNVYEWESPGEGSCSQEESSSVTNGCTYLISGSASEDDSLLVDADPSGSNVFFTYRGELGQAGVPAGRNQIYDARVDGGFQFVGAGCSGSSCSTSVGDESIAGFALPPSVSEVQSDNYAPSPAKPPPKKKELTARQRALAGCKKYRKVQRRLQCEARVNARFKKTKPSRQGKGHKS